MPKNKKGHGKRMKDDKNTLSAFYALIFRQKYIKRWGLMRNTQPETLSEHAAECAILTHALATIGNLELGRSYDTERAVTLALFHDAPEVFTGDMPTPIKYSDSLIREQFARIETQSIESLIGKLPEGFREIYRGILTQASEKDAALHVLVKAADKLCAYIKCIEEEKAGNTEFANAKLSIRAQLAEYGLPELDIFTERFLPAFELTLDAQQAL